MRLHTEIESLKKRILALGAVVEAQLQMAVKSLETRDEKLAKQVIEGDPEIDQMEVDLEEECLKILALHQPVAIDLRFIIAVLKINNDLERIGDLAVNIAERATFLAVQPRVEFPFDFSSMSDKVKSMLKKSLDALVNMDGSLASEVCHLDDEVDQCNREVFRQINESIRNDIEKIKCFIHLLSVSRHLERIADLTTNIAEDVIYMVEGTIIRHKTEDYLK